MTPAPAQPPAPVDLRRLIEEAITSGWAWAVFSQTSSDGPLAWGIEVGEDEGVKRVEQEINRRKNAAFGGITGTGTEKVCRRTASGGFHWQQVTSAA